MAGIRVWLSGLFFRLYLAVQIVLPSKSLFTPGLQRFSWSMFADRIERPDFILRFDDGTRLPLGKLPKRRRIIRMRRSEIDAARFVPPHLRSQLPKLREVSWRVDGAEKTHPCPH